MFPIHLSIFQYIHHHIMSYDMSVAEIENKYISEFGVKFLAPVTIKGNLKQLNDTYINIFLFQKKVQSMTKTMRYSS